MTKRVKEWRETTIESERQTERRKETGGGTRNTTHITAQRNTMQYNTLQCNTTHYNATQAQKLDLNTMQWKTTQHTTTHHNTHREREREGDMRVCQKRKYELSL